MEKTAKRFNRRAFVSSGMLASLAILPVSGIMNHQMQFDAFSVARHIWMSVHNLAALLFTVFILLHLIYNWRPLLNAARKVSTRKPTRESMLAVLVVAVLVGGFALHALHAG